MTIVHVTVATKADAIEYINLTALYPQRTIGVFTEFSKAVYHDKADNLIILTISEG